MSTDEELAQLLHVVQSGDDTDALVDNTMLAATLQWPLTTVAACLQEAKSRSFIWGTRGGQQPGPWFTDLEVTIQGRRFLAGRPAPQSGEVDAS